VRIPHPGSLKLDREQLLEDVRTRLAQVLPDYAEGEEDPSDPGWMLIEQAAWLVEMHSRRLDEYPFNVVQYFIHMMGGQLEPAHPSLGTVVVQVQTEGQLKLDPRHPSAYRFFTSQNEDRDAIEFVPVESLVDLRRAEVNSISDVILGELHVVDQGSTKGPGHLEGHVVWRGDGRKSRMFQSERVVYTITTSTAAQTLKDVEKALELLEERRLGWLSFVAESNDNGQVIVTATVNLALAFEKTVESGLAPGGDITGEWAALDGSTWTPPVFIANSGLLPSRLRGSRPMPGLEEGRIVIPDVPANFDVAGLLERRCEPLPSVVVESIWETFQNLNSKLATARPKVERFFSPADDDTDGEPAWVGSAVASGVWDRVSRGKRRTVVDISMLEPREQASRIRVALVVDGNRGVDMDIEFIGMQGSTVTTATPLKHNVAWTLSLPSPEHEQAMDRVVAFDISLPPKCDGLLMSTDVQARGLLLNALLVANMATVKDGRTVAIERNIPEAVSLLHQDVVTEQVVARLLANAIPDSAAAIVRNFPIAWFDVEGDEPMPNWEGVHVDASSGVITINAPDDEGQMRVFQPGDEVHLHWYRRTDGAHGDVGVGDISLVEQVPNSEPSLFAVRNPLATYYGASRETSEAAVERLFAPSQGTPVLPSDFERLVRQALGSRAQTWMVRVWTYAERSLLSTAVWPVVSSNEAMDPETSALLRDLPRHGPSTLLVALGPKDGKMSADDLDWARRVIRRTIKRQANRTPTVRDALVTRLWPLTLHVASAGRGSDLVLPSYDLAAMQGRLVDQFGRSSAPPAADLLLNGYVSEVVVDMLGEL
jgi:hypothetical protein